MAAAVAHPLLPHAPAGVSIVTDTRSAASAVFTYEITVRPSAPALHYIAVDAATRLASAPVLGWPLRANTTPTTLNTVSRGSTTPICSKYSHSAVLNESDVIVTGRARSRSTPSAKSQRVLGCVCSHAMTAGFMVVSSRRTRCAC
jgi:hypothetical protein